MFLKFGAMHFIYQINRLTTTKGDSTYYISREAVNRIIQSSPAKTCDLDPIPTSLPKKCIELTPIITTIVNNSLTSGIYPDIFKEALVRPLLKKKGTIKMNLKITDQFQILHL